MGIEIGYDWRMGIESGYLEPQFYSGRSTCLENMNRRTFLARAAALSCAVSSSGSAIAHSSGQSPLPSADLIDRMKWLNEPASWKRTGDRIIVSARPKTDFWRKTFYGYITDNGHFLNLAVTGDFVFESRIDGKFVALYDQAGLMVRADAENWMKCGTELVDGARYASVVFTRDYSDWSAIKNVSKSGPVWWRTVRKAESLETLYSLDGKNYTSVRLGYLVPASTVQVGIMCAAPEGSGFECVFDYLKLTLKNEKT
jgi:regulation of enolase protein 1 (concanavalin A-like superfamily)